MASAASLRSNAGKELNSGRRNAKAFNKIKIVPYLFIAPAVVYLTIVTVIPVLMALPISFTDWTALNTKMNFVGLENYKRLLSDSEFHSSLIIMAEFFISIPLILGAGLIQALLLNNKLKGMTVFRVIFYSPVITSTIAVAVLFDWFFQPSFGLFNAMLNTIGLEGIGWVYDAKTAVMSIIIFRVWKNAGVAMLIYLAGLQDVPTELIEAADMDGASWWQKFRYITFPMLKPANVYLIITGIINVFMIFQETYMFLMHTPLRSTTTVVNYVYERGFTYSEMGYASSISFVLFLIILVVTLFQYRVMKADAN